MKQKKRTFSAILALVLVFTFLPLSALAATPTEVNDFSALQSAISDGAEIQLTGDITVTAQISIPTSTEVTLDLNGYTLSGALSTHMILNKGTLTITDSSVEGTGKIEKTNATNQYLIDNSGTMTIEGGTYISNSPSPGASMIRTNVDSETTIENGTFESIFIGLKVEEDGILTIHDGTFTVTGAGASAVQNWGTTTINGGTFESEEGPAVYAASWGEYPSVTTIEGGTFTAKYAIYAALNDDADWGDSESTITVIVNGGTFDGDMPVLVNDQSGSINVTFAEDLYEFVVLFQYENEQSWLERYTSADETADMTFPTDTKSGKVFDGWEFDGISGTHKTLTEALFAELKGTYANGEPIVAISAFHTISTDAGVDSITVADTPADLETGGTTEYTVTVTIPDGTTITAADFEVETTDAHATVGAATYDTTDEVWEIVVTAEDGSTTETYKVAVTTEHTPAAPTGVTATAGNGQITITWVAPSDVGDSAITDYKIVVDGGNPFSVGDVTTHTITGLTNGTSYSITVAAVNGDGTGAASAVVSATPVAPSTGGGSGGGTPSAKPEEKPADEPEASEEEAVAPIFSDVSEDAWYAEDVAYVYENGLMTGTGDGTFSPNTNMTRAMIATVLHRFADTPDANGAGFTDVADGAWYSDAIAWAQENGVVKGYGDGSFGPNNNVTRQDLAVILARFIERYSLELPLEREAPDFADADSTADYAQDAVTLLYRIGVINGKDNNRFDPTGLATRAEVAAMISRFVQLIAE